MPETCDDAGDRSGLQRQGAGRLRRRICKQMGLQVWHRLRCPHVGVTRGNDTLLATEPVAGCLLRRLKLGFRITALWTSLHWRGNLGQSTSCSRVQAVAATSSSSSSARFGLGSGPGFGAWQQGQPGALGTARNSGRLGLKELLFWVCLGGLGALNSSAAC